MNITIETAHVDLSPRPHRHIAQVYFDGDYQPHDNMPGHTRDNAYTKMEDHLKNKGLPGPYKRIDRQ